MYENAKQLRAVKLNEGLEILYDRCFCGSGVKKVCFSSTIKEIPYKSFYECENLRHVVFPENS